ncbi:DUF1566 domain-containing protein [Yoonia sp. I 8.24]|uniref:Lcl C-terminal domain-containing protein n=1 Tax=Yoonia sp. I 8.24 TaxID=1537229 RepID=UPI001EE0375B|nr:DUF1566 domain-containing protein [Yoonia sp. I 8.24]MCG3267936.1 DUF1566 domain-containing protein [Yoonia sp. I 8.24]
MMKKPLSANRRMPFLSVLAVLIGAAPVFAEAPFPVPDTMQTTCFDAAHEMACPSARSAFSGQDAQFTSNPVSYTDNGDGTVTDNVTGLMWQQSVDLNGDGVINAADKLTYEEAAAGAASFNLGGYTDWRLPTIKEAYSLILFSGQDSTGYNGTTSDGIEPFIDDDIFHYGYGDVDAGERLLEAQMATSTLYGTTTRGEQTMFGVNFVDGRIKGYGLETSFSGGPKVFYVMYVRGDTGYGVNDFTDNQDGTITDQASGLIWAQQDSGQGMSWEDALSYARDAEIAGYTDWRMPNAKELQNLLDYSRAPATTQSAAIDPLFASSQITNEAGEADYPYYWTGTTHASWNDRRAGMSAVYISFGTAPGYVRNAWIDIHGAGAQRSDPKIGDPDDYPEGFGPQGDAIRILNYVRLVRDAG